jgi:hypothetical protein
MAPRSSALSGTRSRKQAGPPPFFIEQRARSRRGATLFRRDDRHCVVGQAHELRIEGVRTHRVVDWELLIRGDFELEFVAEPSPKLSQARAAAHEGELMNQEQLRVADCQDVAVKRPRVDPFGRLLQKQQLIFAQTVEPGAGDARFPRLARRIGAWARARFCFAPPTKNVHDAE